MRVPDGERGGQPVAATGRGDPPLHRAALHRAALHRAALHRAALHRAAMLAAARCGAGATRYFGASHTGGGGIAMNVPVGVSVGGVTAGSLSDTAGMDFR